MEIEEDSPVLIAICCAVDISAEAKTQFLQVNDEYFGTPNENFVFVDSLTFVHTVPDLAGDHFQPSSTDSPFKGKNATECAALLKRLVANTGAFILNTCFAFFDERSLQDGSIILIQTIDDELEQMRAVPEVACAKLLQYMIGDADITEDQEDAEDEDDGVFRLRDEFIED